MNANVIRGGRINSLSGEVVVLLYDDRVTEPVTIFKLVIIVPSAWFLSLWYLSSHNGRSFLPLHLPGDKSCCAT